MVVGTTIFKTQIENYVQKKELPMTRIRTFQEKKMEGGEGRFHCLVGNGRRMRNTFPPLPTFPPTNFT
jgi:hypothetical protein